MKGMQQLNDITLILKNVFKFLNLKDLIVTSRVCVSWHIISNDEVLWRHIRLKNVMVYDWDKFMYTLYSKRSITLNTSHMLIPTELQDVNNFWKKFSLAIKKVTTLNELVLNRCPINVVQECMLVLPRLSVFNAISKRNPNATQDTDVVTYESINLRPVSRMIHLIHLRLKGLTGIILEPSPKLTFLNLRKLRTLSLTSIKSFPNDIFQSFKTVTTSLEHLEIGDCEYILDDLPIFIQRFTKLKILRLENCGKWENCTKKIFVAIRSLKNLKILELINIELSYCVKEEIENCTGLDSLLIIPLYVCNSSITNRLLVDCLKNLSETLKYVVWGLTSELLHITDLFIAQCLQNQPTHSYHISTFKPFNNIPILKPMEAISQVEDMEVDENIDAEILSLPALRKLLKEMLVNTKTKVIKVHFAGTTRVYLKSIFKLN